MDTGIAVRRAGPSIGSKALLYALALCAAHSAAARELDAGQRLLSNFVNDVQTLSARFEQSLVGADGEVIETSSGTVDIRRPGRFRWAYELPYEQLLLADGLNIWSYDVDLAQVTVKPQAEVLSNTPALLLGGSGDVLEDFDYIGSYEDRGTVWVRLRPKESRQGFRKIEMGFNNGSLTRMMFDDTLDQTTLVALTDISVNAPQADDFFKFVLPEDVDLVGVPIVAETLNSLDTAEK